MGLNFSFSIITFLSSFRTYERNVWLWWKISNNLMGWIMMAERQITQQGQMFPKVFTHTWENVVLFHLGFQETRLGTRNLRQSEMENMRERVFPHLFSGVRNVSHSSYSPTQGGGQQQRLMMDEDLANPYTRIVCLSRSQHSQQTRQRTQASRTSDDSPRAFSKAVFSLSLLFTTRYQSKSEISF